MKKVLFGCVLAIICMGSFSSWAVDYVNPEDLEAIFDERVMVKPYVRAKDIVITGVKKEVVAEDDDAESSKKVVEKAKVDFFGDVDANEIEKQQLLDVSEDDDVKDVLNFSKKDKEEVRVIQAEEKKNTAVKDSDDDKNSVVNNESVALQEDVKPGADEKKGEKESVTSEILSAEELVDEKFSVKYDDSDVDDGQRVNDGFEPFYMKSIKENRKAREIELQVYQELKAEQEARKEEGKEWFKKHIFEKNEEESEEEILKREAKESYRLDVEKCDGLLHDVAGIESELLYQGNLYDNTAHLSQTFIDVSDCYQKTGLAVINEFYANDMAVSNDFEKKIEEVKVYGNGYKLDTNFCEGDCSVQGLARQQISQFDNLKVFILELLDKA